MHKREWVSVLCGDNVEVLKRYTVNQKLGVNTKDGGGYTPLHIAVKMKLLCCFDYLIEHKANIYAKTREGDTMLHLACECGDYMMISTFLAMGINPNARNKKGITPLMSYINESRTKNIKIVDLLLQSGSNIQAVSSDGQSILDFAHYIQTTHFIPPLTNSYEIGNKQKKRFLKDLVYRGACYSRTSHIVRYRGAVRLRKSLGRCKLAMSCLQRILTRKKVHKDIVPGILDLVWKTHKDEKLWG